MARTTLLVVFLVIQTCRGFPGRGLVYPERSDLLELSVLHINDFHARFQQISPTFGECYDNEKTDCVGGIARIYTAAHQLVKERPNAIFLNAGDNFQGTIWYSLHRWNATATFMNMLPHDAMTLGNHEFDDKIAGVVPFLKMIDTPVVVTNIDASEEPTMQGLYANSTIIVRNGTQIGIIGVIVSATNVMSSTERLKFLDEVESVSEEAARLKEKGVNIVIVLSHCGLDIDRILAAKSPNIDLIVGGHSHTLLYTGTPPNNDKTEGEYPVVVMQEESNRTVLIVQASSLSKYLGNLTVWFDTNGEVVDWDGNPIVLDSSIEENPKVLAAMAPWQAEVDALGNKVIGKTKVFLQNNCRIAECNMGNLITDAMVNAWVDEAESKEYWTYAAIAGINVGGIRNSIEDKNENVTYASLVMVQPFGDTWDVIELKGSDFLRVLEASVADSYRDDVFIGKNLLTWSGIKVTFNLSNEAYSRVVDLKVRCRACTIPKYENLVEDQWYRIITTHYLAQGGGCFTSVMANRRNHVVGTLDIDSLVKYIEKMSPITYGTDSRLVFTGKWQRLGKA